MLDYLANLIGVGRATLIDDSGEVQLLQVTEGANGSGFADRVTDKVRRVSEFGFASVPPIGSEVLILRRLAQRARSIIIGTSHRPSRPTGLEPGDAGIYDLRGAKVMLTKQGLMIDCAGLDAVVQNAPNITLKATTRVTIDAPNVEFTGALHAAGAITTDGDVTSASHSFSMLRTAFNGHKHTGVKAGTDTSAVTDSLA